MAVNLQLPNDVTIQSVQELAWNDVAIDFLSHQVAAEEFAATTTALDPRFVNQASGKLLMSFHSIRSQL